MTPGRINSNTLIRLHVQLLALVMDETHWVWFTKGLENLVKKIRELEPRGFHLVVMAILWAIRQITVKKTWEAFSLPRVPMENIAFNILYTRERVFTCSFEHEQFTNPSNSMFENA